VRILFIDPTSPSGHKNYNYGLLRNLQQIGEVDIAIRDNYLDLENNAIVGNVVFEIPENFIPENLNKKHKIRWIRFLSRMLGQYRCMTELLKSLHLAEYDLVVFSSVEVIPFMLAIRKASKRVLFVEHGIANLKKEFLKRLAYKYMPPNAELIVMEDYIVDYMKNSIGFSNSVYRVPHPLPPVKVHTSPSLKEVKKRLTIIAPGASNDESFISFIRDNHLSIPNKVRLVLRSNDREFESESLLIYNKKLDEKQYFNNIANSDFTLLPYGTNYNYRTSGVYFESLIYGKPVIVDGRSTLRYYHEKHPNIVLTFDGHRGFLKMLEGIQSKRTEDLEGDFTKALNEYSDERIRASFLSILCNNSCEETVLNQFPQ